MIPKKQQQNAIIFIVWTTFTLFCYVQSSAIDIVLNKTDYSDNEDKSSDITAAAANVVKKLGKKKAYGTLNKSSPPLEEQSLLDALDTHPAGFDFNLDDLEDIHENFKKGDLSDEDELLLRDSEFEFTSNLPNTVQGLYQGSNDSQQHIFKVSKGVKQKMKNLDVIKKDEYHKHSGLRFNSFDTPAIAVGNASDVLRGEGEDVFPVVISLYNHYHWEPAEIRNRVSAACGVEFYAYYSALSNHVEWAQRAFDSSGQYRGQFLYNNDLWLGERIFCEEVNHRVNQSEREQFAFGFNIARILIKNFQGSVEPKVLNVGQCLPKSCNPKDVQAILELDPHAKVYQGSSSLDKLRIEVVSVRRVPGDYVIWNDKGFYILSSICIIIACITITATIYGSMIESNNQDTEEKFKNVEKQDAENGKTFELFQMQTAKATGTVNNNNNTNMEMGTTNETQASEHKQVAERNLAKDMNHEVDISMKKKLRISFQILLCFSLSTNAKTIFSAVNSNEKVLASTHGMKVLSLFWTMLVHTYIYVFNVGENKYRRTITERSFAFQFIGNATFSVDTFFFISGLLVTYLFLKQKKPSEKQTSTFAKKGTVETLYLILYRFLRLTPAYLFVIFFNRVALEYILNDSVFTPSLIDYPACAKYWWRNVLYINNWYPFKEFCMHWSWYLSNDMQFYTMAVILLIVSRRYFKFSVVVLLMFLCTSWATSGIVSLHFNYVFKLAKPFSSFDILYDKPWQRIGTYIVGMITGHIIYSVKTPPRVPFVVNMSMWLCTLGVFFALVFGVWSGELGLLSTAFYVGIGHTAWACGLVWITLSCCWGLCRPVNKFLSYSGFLPLSRLTYCIYLIHPIVMSIVTFHMKGPMNLQHPIVLTVFFGFTVLSIIAGLIVSLLFESPMIRLLKIVFHR